MLTRGERKREPKLRAIAFRNSARITNSKISRRKLPIWSQTAFYVREMSESQGLGFAPALGAWLVWSCRAAGSAGGIDLLFQARQGGVVGILLI